MPPPLDRTRFLLEPTRLAVAELCRDEALTLGEIADELRRRPGSLSQPGTMLRNGALIRGASRFASDGRGGGKTFRLNPEWVEVLEEARRRRAPAWPSAGQDLLLIRMQDASRAASVLAEQVPSDIEWGARVHGGMSGLILAPARDEAGQSTLRVVDALTDDVREIVELHLGKVMSPSELQAWCAALSSGRAQLPPSS